MKRSTGVALSILALFLFLIIGNIPRTASGPAAVNPAPLPSLISDLKSTAGKQHELPEITQGALQQIQGLLEEKQSRTAAQQKIDSQLIYAIKMRRGTSVATGVQTLTVDVGADDAGLVDIDITAIIDRQLLAELAGMKIEVSSVFPQYHTLRAVASLDQLEAIAALSQVRFIQPKQEAMYSQGPWQTQNLTDVAAGSKEFSDRAARVEAQIQQVITFAPLAASSGAIGSATSQGDTTHKAFSARGTFNTDGSGIKIGVLSDGVTSLATSQATGDLGAVTVLPGQGGSGNEGIAMLEIIHDLAPGAQLFFATAGGGLANFAQNIRDLRSAGCDIIVDDVGYFVESPFQDGQAPGVLSTNNAGLATQAVNDVVASGALYFSSAANSGNKNDGTSGTWEGDFVDGGALGLTPGGVVHDFDPTAAVSQFDTITSSGGPLNLHWSDPLGGSSNDYDLFVLNSTSTAVIASSTNIQSGTQDPYEQVNSGNITNNRVVIVQKAGAAARFLHLSTNRGRLSFNTEGDTHGHNAASGGYGVAAVCASCVYPSVFSSANSVETFSSDGPRRIFFNANSTAITPGDVSSTGGTVLQKPNLTAADGVSVSGAGGFASPFFGTSAAAPHAAAIAALIRSANPGLTQAQINTALTGTAIDIEGAGTDRDSGAGIVMPYSAMQSLGAPVFGKAFLELSTVSQTETCCNANGIIEPGDSAALTITLNNTGLLDATGINATLTSSTPGVTILNSSSAYPNLAASIGSSTSSTPFSVSLNSSMPADPKVNFTLTINYSGGHNASQLLDFAVQFGRLPITTTLDGTAPPTSASYPVTATGVQTGRLVRNDPPSTCALPQPNPGPNDSLLHNFDSYTLTNSFNGATACVTVTLTPQTTALYQAAAYLGSYDSANVTTNYLADIGGSPAPFTGKSFSFSLGAGQTVVIVVNEVISSGSLGTSYTLQVSGLASSGSGGPTPTPTPTPTPSPAPTPTPAASDLVISQIYGGGGTSGATYQNSFLEIFNRGNAAVNLNQWKFQFASSPTGPFDTTLSFVSSSGIPIQPGQHMLIQLGPTGSGAPLPVFPDFVVPPLNIGLSGKIAITKPGTSPLFGTCPLPDPNVVDFVGFGSTANCFEGSGPTPTLNNTTAVIRKNNGCTDTNNNASDFLAGSPSPRNTSSTFNLCGASIQLSAANYNVGEAGSSAVVTVTRGGDTSAASTVDFATSDGTARQRSDYEVANGTLNFAAGEDSKTFKVFIVDDAYVEGNETINLTLSNPTGGALAGPSTATITIVDNDTAVSISPVPKQFVTTMTAGQVVPPVISNGFGGGVVQLSEGETSAKVSLIFSGLSGSEFLASIRGPAGPAVNGPIVFNLPLGTPVIDFPISPTAPQVADLKARLHFMNIHTSGFANGEIRGQLQWNPAEEAQFFVRQAYFDFLSRTPDPGGLAFWTNEITQCQSDVQCLRAKRVDVSNAFYFEQEFQQTGAFVYRLYRAAYGNNQPFPNPNPNPGFPDEEKKLPSYAVFVADRARVIGGTNLGQKQLALANLFVGRPEFLTRYPASLATADQFVDAVLATQTELGLNLSAERGNLINLYNTQGGRGAVMYRLADDNSTNPIDNRAFINAEYNRAFVITQYFGYLRRNPDIPGFRFWLDQVNSAPLRDVSKQHAMVCSFITSVEFQLRFGPVASRNNGECPQ